MDRKMINPLSTLQWVERSRIRPNDYNPNKVSKQNLKLLKQSILANGWTLPIVVRPDFTIIDGFHRWTVAGEEPLVSMLEGRVPVVVVEHKDKAGNIYGTVTHNRARGDTPAWADESDCQRTYGRRKVRKRDRKTAWNAAGRSISAF